MNKNSIVEGQLKSIQNFVNKPFNEADLTKFFEQKWDKLISPEYLNTIDGKPYNALVDLVSEVENYYTSILKNEGNFLVVTKDLSINKWYEHLLQLRLSVN